ncbi:MAG: DUF4159 domain-containing protein [Planctomycetes bacterium]|nr:DUF4159 domain-containing protein [Planctomycetota bacterium]
METKKTADVFGSFSFSVRSPKDKSWLKGLLLIALIFVVYVPAQGKESDWFIYLGNKTKAKSPRRHMSAAEALPPLPLPATPLRRTERKKPPQPDYLIGKVIWGESASFVDSSGGKMKIADWNLCPTDMERFVGNGRSMDLKYHWQNVNLNDFHFDPKKLPALLFSGVRILRLSQTHIQALREYVLAGGMIICDSIAGSPYFYESAKKVFLEVFPESRFRVIPSDHPFYHMLVDVKKVSYPKKPGSTKPFMECIYVGSRIGVLVSKYGLGCGWNRDVTRLEKLPKAVYYDVKSAGQLGLNLAAYVVGYAEVGLLEGQPEVFGAADQKRPTDEFVFAQLKHEGAWNVHPGGATALLMKLRRYTAIRVNLKRVAVDAEKDDLSSYPFLYLTGLDDFSFSPEAVTALRRYLNYGGVLLVNNGMGLSTFDRAVRRELAKILPDVELELIPANHHLYNSLLTIKEVRYSPVVAKNKPPPAAGLIKPSVAGLKNKPYLLGATIDGDLRVLYSPYDLEAGWLDAYYPLIRGYEPIYAQQLGLNIITYVMTH